MSGKDLVSELRSGSKPAPVPREPGGLKDLALVAVAIIAMASLGYYGVTTWFAPRGPQPAAAMAVAAAPQPTIEPWTEADTSTCKARARKAAAEPLPADVMLAQQSVTEGFAGMTTLIACQMSLKSERFCEGKEKRRLVAMINDYLAKVDMITTGLGVQGAPMAMAGALLGGEAAFGSDVYEMQREGTMKVMELHHQKVLKALRSLARDGIIAPADFAGFMGMGVPKAVTEMFGGVEAERRVCG
jgi:hypothetical protein